MFKLLLVISLVAPGLVFAEKEYSNSELQKLLKTKILLARHIGLNPVMIGAVSEQNSQNLSLGEIKKRDNKWKSSKKLTQFKLFLQQNDAGSYLKQLVTKNKYVNEAFLTDNQGANVASYPATSDYWQGDEKKWKASFNDGVGKVFVGPVKVDESTNETTVQISAPVTNRYSSSTLGVIVIGVNVDYIK